MPVTKDEIITFLTEQFELSAEILDDELPLFSSALLDSTDMVALVTFLEERHGMSVDVADLTLGNFDSIAAIVKFCENTSLEG